MHPIMPRPAWHCVLLSRAPSLLQTLYESSVAFGMRKALQTEAGKSELESQVESLQDEKKDLERQVGAGSGARYCMAGLDWHVSCPVDNGDRSGILHPPAVGPAPE